MVFYGNYLASASLRLIIWTSSSLPADPHLHSHAYKFVELITMCTCLVVDVTLVLHNLGRPQRGVSMTCSFAGGNLIRSIT
jgi:hypothetical protein